MSKEYSAEQISIARSYERRCMANINNDAEFDRLMAEFDALKKEWDSEPSTGENCAEPQEGTR